MATDNYYPSAQLTRAIAKAREQRAVIAALYTSERCPFCIALKKEQLSPRMRSDARPSLIVVEFDADTTQPFNLPDGRRMTAKEWGRLHKLSLFPTLLMIDDAANPITPPLVGYASRDFYPVYLEEAITSAQAITTQQRATPR